MEIEKEKESKTNVEKSDGSDKYVHYGKSPALEFGVLKEFNKTARASLLTLPHGPVNTPVFMPVGTQGAMKGLLPSEMVDLGCQILLGNTYHLGLRPGTEIIDELGGIHKFCNWPNNVLTDSGGFQMVSLLDLAEFSEKGVKFQSPVDGTEMLLTPEKSIHLQNEIGSDIVMALDDVVPATANDPKRFEEACYRTIRWIDRCISAHKRPNEQNLFGIVQGGLDSKLRDYCLSEMVKRDSKLPGYAIGGLCGGEAKDSFWRTVYQCCCKLPKNKPKYVMGVGYPLDLIICVALGADMFDCVYPCRTARFGTALVKSGELHLKKKDFKNDFNVIDNQCDCPTCQCGKGYTRAFLHSIVTKESTCVPLVSAHNIKYLLNLMKNIRNSILNGTFDKFVASFLKDMFPNGKNTYPKWVLDALNTVGIKI